MIGYSKFSAWVNANSTGKMEKCYVNGISYVLVMMNDGWIAIFERTEEGMYIPKIQAADMPRAMDWCYMTERPRVPVTAI